MQNFPDSNRILHIIYLGYCHYNSVRNMDGSLPSTSLSHKTTGENIVLSKGDSVSSSDSQPSIPSSSLTSNHLGTDMTVHHSEENVEQTSSESESEEDPHENLASLLGNQLSDEDSEEDEDFVPGEDDDLSNDEIPLEDVVEEDLTNIDQPCDECCCCMSSFFVMTL